MLAFTFYLKYLLRCCDHKSSQTIPICEKPVRFCEKSRKEKYLYETAQQMWSWQDTSSSNIRREWIIAWALVHLPVETWLLQWGLWSSLAQYRWVFRCSVSLKSKVKNTVHRDHLQGPVLPPWLHSLRTPGNLMTDPVFILSVDLIRAPFLALPLSSVLAPST